MDSLGLTWDFKVRKVSIQLESVSEGDSILETEMAEPLSVLFKS